MKSLNRDSAKTYFPIRSQPEVPGGGTLLADKMFPAWVQLWTPLGLRQSWAGLGRPALDDKSLADSCLCEGLSSPWEGTQPRGGGGGGGNGRGGVERAGHLGTTVSAFSEHLPAPFLLWSERE